MKETDEQNWLENVWGEKSYECMYMSEPPRQHDVSLRGKWGLEDRVISTSLCSIHPNAKTVEVSER